ncbi:MAG: hypothetical protein MJ072_06040, partial [Clostridia bacterium]|nr:hypothetical protein [Clostridia bacterium]
MKEIKNIPDVFTFFNGEKVQNEKDWKLRRQEIVDWFNHNVYGEFPSGAENGFTFNVLKDEVKGVIRIKTVGVVRGNFKSVFRLYLPVNKVKPSVIVYVSLRFYDDIFDFENGVNFDKTPSKTTLPISDVLNRGYALAVFKTSDVVSEEEDIYNEDFCKEFFDKRTENSVGAIACWSFFARRIADYLQTDKDVDSTRIGVAGHSRGGKTSLLTAVNDERFKFCYVSNSGCTGASIARDNTGETVKKINDRFPFWFNLAYRKYNDNEFEMPTDFHELVSTVA